MIKNIRGVSLLELIAVIVILGIIAAVGGITATTTIANARKSTCNANMVIIEKTYFNENIFRLTLGLNEDDLEKSMTAGKCHYDEEKLAYVGGCPDGGEYEVTYVETGAISVICTHHGSNNNKVINVEEVFDDIFSLDAVNAYWNRQNSNGIKKGACIDSTANVAADSTAAQVTKELKEMGFDTDNISWRIYQLANGNYHFYYCDEDISNMPIGTVVVCKKYDSATREITTVNRVISENEAFGETYNILANP